MTTGQVIFYSGVGLFVFTIVLGIVFWLKKPQYIPENASYTGGADKGTRKLRSGYPTDRLTIRRGPEQPIVAKTAVLQEDTAQLEKGRSDIRPYTAVLSETGTSLEPQTEKMSVGTVPLSEGTVPLMDDESTVQLSPDPVVPIVETESLNRTALLTDTENQDTTTLL